ncbi:hypothetical protein AAFC00_004390 [Neodothiora populina]|uniref:Tyrosinase copper-binding domain-containing protein n=1 Tax=Neodothiora populina TaxID=2781224 RepID=A0ABR3PJT2_9PEZI
MRGSGILVAILACASSLSAAQDAADVPDYTDAEILNGTALNDLAEIANSNLEGAGSSKRSSTCSLKTASARVEWRTMPKQMRKSYTDAVMCLQNTPPQVMTAAEAPSYPGIKSRYDEYLATHINYTLQIHFTADFLAWHRFYIHSYEQDLKNLCGYTGHLPYWNWPTDAQAPEKSSLFNGDAYSMGSNGVFIPGRGDLYLANQDTTAPPGTGGGCIYKGPFKDYKANLGPIDTANTTGVASPYDYNPHCVIRDLNGYFSSRWNSWKNVTDLILDSPDIATFQGVAQADSSYVAVGNFGVHGGGHFTPGAAGAMSDFYSSPADPLFYLHHAMIDRVWTIWQLLDLPKRQYAISGTSTLLNMPPSPEMKLSDSIPFGFVAPSQILGDLLNTFSGPFCYYYL